MSTFGEPFSKPFKPDEPPTQAEIQDSLDRIKESLSGVVSEIVQSMTPPASEALQAIKEVEQSVNGYLATGLKHPWEVYNAISESVAHHIISRLGEIYEFAAIAGVQPPNDSDLPPAPPLAQYFAGLTAPLPSSVVNRKRKGSVQAEPISSPTDSQSSPQEDSGVSSPGPEASTPATAPAGAFSPQQVSGINFLTCEQTSDYIIGYSGPVWWVVHNPDDTYTWVQSPNFEVRPNGWISGPWMSEGTASLWAGMCIGCTPGSPDCPTGPPTDGPPEKCPPPPPPPPPCPTDDSPVRWDCFQSINGQCYTVPTTASPANVGDRWRGRFSTRTQAEEACRQCPSSEPPPPPPGEDSCAPGADIRWLTNQCSDAQVRTFYDHLGLDMPKELGKKTYRKLLEETVGSAGEQLLQKPDRTLSALWNSAFDYE